MAHALSMAQLFGKVQEQPSPLSQNWASKQSQLQSRFTGDTVNALRWHRCLTWRVSLATCKSRGSRAVLLWLHVCTSLRLHAEKALPARCSPG